MSLSASPFDLFLDDLLNPASRWFEWIGRLGHIRETRTALSGLFGRFVARAYLTQVWNIQHFLPLHANITEIAPGHDMAAIRVEKGDLPDWIVAPSPSSGWVAIAEAKGSHNAAGPWASLEAAKKQARRVDIFRGIDRVVTKRIAIATRWAVHGDPKLDQPWLVVDDPDDGDVVLEPKEFGHLRRGIALGHYAALASGFGLSATANAIVEAQANPPGQLQLPAEDLVLVREKGEEQMAFGGILARSGVLPLPGAIADGYVQSLRSVFGERVMFVAVTAEAVLEADRIGLTDEKGPVGMDADFQWYPDMYRRASPAALTEEQAVETPPPEPVVSPDTDAQDFWRQRRTAAAGFEFRPLDDLELARAATA